jgi:hypothetical protein
MKKEKQEIITFKAPESLREALRGLPNRSEFIRAAVVTALDNVCPLCKGAGVIMPHQREHWDTFLMDHHVEECSACKSVLLVCDRDRGASHKIHDTEVLKKQKKL